MSSHKIRHDSICCSSIQMWTLSASVSWGNSFYCVLFLFSGLTSLCHALVYRGTVVPIGTASQSCPDWKNSCWEWGCPDINTVQMLSPMTQWEMNVTDVLLYITNEHSVRWANEWCCLYRTVEYTHITLYISLLQTKRWQYRKDMLLYERFCCFYKDLVFVQYFFPYINLLCI